jgi:DNA gyrase subunit A
LDELTNLTRRGITILKLKDDDELLLTQFTKPGEQITLASSGGRLLKFAANDEQLPVMGRTAMGLQAFRLLRNQQMVGCVSATQAEYLLLFTEQGYAKRLPINQIKAANRGDLGTQAMKFDNKTDILASMVGVNAESEAAIITNKERVLRIPTDSVPILPRDGKGESILQLNRDEKVIAVVEVR